MLANQHNYMHSVQSKWMPSGNNVSKTASKTQRGRRGAESDRREARVGGMRNVHLNYITKNNW